MMKRKICVVTGSRAEYGLLYWLIKKIETDKQLELQIIVTGMHLSPEFGLTYKEIEKDFKIDKKIEVLLSSDTSVGITKSMGLAQISFSETYKDLKPSILVVVGDRYEIFSAVIAAMIAQIPVAHIHGGETTEGAFDEAIRHSITKMSHLHFTATKEYQNRVIQLGEQPNKVFHSGALGIESIYKLKPLNKKDLEQSLKFKFNKKNILVTFHSVTLETSTAKKQFQELLSAIDELKDTNIIFTKGNSDTDGRIINKMIDKYTAKNKHKSFEYTSLGQIKYLSTLKYIDAVVGNSSSGIIEAPSFNIGTINIGDRQKGRIKSDSIIDCLPEKISINKAFKLLYSREFQKKLESNKNPYDNGYPSEKIIDTLKRVELGPILKKTFFDIKFFT